MTTNENQIVVYQPNETVRLDVRLENETVWLTQSQMATLFGCSTDNIGLHLKNVYSVGELSRDATAEDFSVVRLEGLRQVRRTVTCYNLDAIISVGYRVNSILGKYGDGPRKRLVKGPFGRCRGHGGRRVAQGEEGREQGAWAR